VTDLTVPDLLGVCSRRWSIEILFRELKQLFGFADSTARKKAAVLRVAPFVGLRQTTLVLWCSSSADALKLAALPPRPWYRHKRNLAAADLLRAARRATGHDGAASERVLQMAEEAAASGVKVDIRSYKAA